jgi:hypothetical protein
MNSGAINPAALSPGTNINRDTIGAPATIASYPMSVCRETNFASFNRRLLSLRNATASASACSLTIFVPGLQRSQSASAVSGSIFSLRMTIASRQAARRKLYRACAMLHI